MLFVCVYVSQYLQAIVVFLANFAIVICSETHTENKHGKMDACRVSAAITTIR